jgi:membrane-associated protease RseP (regulator of RpoE activity)
MAIPAGCILPGIGEVGETIGLNIREQLSRIPFLNLEPAPPVEDVMPTGWPSTRELALPVLLFFLTLVTTTLANGPFYGACVVGILLVHEMGHYLMCRRYKVPSTLPYFIPLPPQISFLGTLGAVIRMRLRTGERRVLYDIGIAGPLAGFVVAIPVTLFGLTLSRVTHGPGGGEGLLLGESLLFRLLERLVLGPTAPTDIVVLHPVALAGWTGLFVTGLNLIPVGMLDGGHVSYGLLGRRAIWLALAAMATLAVLAIFVFQGWFFWLGLLLLIGVRHPASRLPSKPIGLRRVVLGIFTLLLFVICFVPRPFALHP